MAFAFEDWYKGIPIVTRTYVTASVLTTIAVHLEIVSTFDLYLHFPLVLHKYQLWRLVTNFLFFDMLGLNFVFHMFFLLRHSQALEESSFRGRTADYVYMWLFGAVMLLGMDAVVVYTSLNQILPKLNFLSMSLAFMAVYVWSRRNVNVRMNFLGLFNFSAPYLPWVILGFGLLLGQNPIYDLLGIIVGHVYYFLEDVYPEITGRRPLKTPAFLKALLDTPEAVAPAAAVRQQRANAFGGGLMAQNPDDER